MMRWRLSDDTVRMILRLIFAILSMAVCVALCFTGCKKSNEISINTPQGDESIGEACAAQEDCFGPTVACVAGRCRTPCTSDAQCADESICLGGDEGGCSLPVETGCDDDSCGDELTCGQDNQCRHACQADGDCPRGDQKCALGTCFSPGEDGFCTTGAFCCVESADTVGADNCVDPPSADDFIEGGPVLAVCNTRGIGWVAAATCASAEVCGTTRAALCDELGGDCVASSVDDVPFSCEE